MKKGLVLINALVFGVIATVIVTSLVSWGSTILRSSRSLVAREQAFQIAEAGIEYYRWHLAHASTDYYDGNASTTSPGPYTHTFYDKDGNSIGHYDLTVTPPTSGSTLVKIKSKGVFDVAGGVSSSRSVQVSLAIPSFAKYAVAANDVTRFGAGTEVFGPIHSNNGIRFDGIAHNLITSSKTFYDDPDDPGHNRFGVYTQDSPVDPDYPAAVPNRLDVFMAGRQFPVPTIDFNGITANLSQIKTDATASGRYFAPSGAQGYYMLLKTNDTFDLYKVNTLVTAPSGCPDVSVKTEWSTWSIATKTFVANYTFPANGLIFVEDTLWVEGTVDTARITIAAAKFPDSPSTRKNIIVNNALRYTNTDGRDVVALIAQGNFNIGMVSADNLEIDAAIIAQNGRIGRYYYNNNCKIGSNNYSTRTLITLYGMLASNLRYGFAYTDNTGYLTRNIVYDGNLLYAPPPSFPLTSSQYQIISWDEVK